MKKTSESTEVIILGAGASANFTPTGYPFNQTPIAIPLAKDFFEEAIKQGVLKQQNPIGQPLYLELLDFIKEKFNFSFQDLKKEESELSVEDVYSELDKSITQLGKSKNLDEMNPYFAQRDLLYLIWELFSKLSRHYGPCENHAILAKHIVENESIVISFNWDTLIDEALHNTQEWFYETGYGIEFKKIYLNKVQIPGEKKRSKGLLLKPHGSINWFRYRDHPWSDKNGFTGEPVSKSELEETFFFEFTKIAPQNIHPKDMRLNLAKNYKPLLKKPCEIDIIPPIPPGQKSKLAERPAFQIIWDKVIIPIAKAEYVIVAGYALKESYIQEKLKEARRRSTKPLLLTLVDNSAGDLQFVNRYKEIFNPDKITIFKDFCEFTKSLDKNPK
jgi:hypothetical protein